MTAGLPHIRIGNCARIVVSTAAVFAVTALIALAQAPSLDDIYRQAVAANDRGDTLSAIALYKRLVELQPNSAELHANLGIALVHAGRYNEAVSEYKQAQTLAPQSPGIALDLALAWYKAADFAAAALELEKVRRLQPDSTQALYLLSDCYVRMGRNKEAIELLRPAYKEHPDDRTVDYLFGMALIGGGQVQQGSEVIDRILHDGSTPEAGILLGAAQLAAGDHKAASATLRSAANLNPQLPGVWSLLGRALLDNEEYDEAKIAFHRALAADSNDFDANLYLGGILRHDGQLEEAVPFLEAALRLRPDSEKAQYQMGALKAAAGSPEEALKYLEPLAIRQPDFQQVHVQLALVYQQLHRTADSRRERQAVTTLDEQIRNAKKPQP